MNSEEKRKNETKAILEEILAKNFQILTREIKSHIQGAL